MLKFEFEEKEVKALKELINVANKALGVQVAEAALVLTKKLSKPIIEDKKCCGNEVSPIKPEEVK